MAPSIDVVIPVYEAPDPTRRCIESLYRHAAGSIDRVIVHDDASGPETARVLDSMRFPRLEILRSTENVGFGQGVNRAVRAATAPYVLVLNSDTEAEHDFVAPLTDALSRNDRLGAISPSGPAMASYDLDACARRDGCVQTFAIFAFAFAIRRDAFLQAGGFDPVFGRGYYEDSDLSRKLLDDGWWFGVHPDARLTHHVHGSFSDAEVRGLLSRNSEIYYARHPGARRRVLLLGGPGRYESLPSVLREEALRVLRGGGEIRWVRSGSPAGLPALQVRVERGGTWRAMRLLWTRRRKRFRRFTDVWLVEAAGLPGRAALAPLARWANARVTLWNARPAEGRD